MRRPNHHPGTSTASGITPAVVALTVSILLSTAAEAQWTQFGGPGQAFTADSKGLAKEWPEEGPPKLWSRKLGEGHSSILVDDGRLFTMYRADPEERAICLDAATGKTLWEYAYESYPLEVHESTYGRGPNATPLLSDGRLYTIGIAGVMHCLDATDGKVIWTRKLWQKPRKHPHMFGY